MEMQWAPRGSLLATDLMLAGPMVHYSAGVMAVTRAEQRVGLRGLKLVGLMADYSAGAKAEMKAEMMIDPRVREMERNLVGQIIGQMADW